MSTSLFPSSDQLLGAIHDAPVGMALVAVSEPEPGRFVSVNRAFCDISGRSEGELLGCTVESIGHPDDVEQEYVHLRRLLSGDIGSYELEARLVAPGGDTRWVRVYASLLHDEQAVPLYAIRQIVDITELKRLLASRAAMIGVALDAVVGMDAEGLITEFNPAAERIFGYSREVVIGRPLAELLIPPAQRESHRSGFRRVVQGGESRIIGRRTELIAMRADGSEFPVELTITRTHADPPEFTGFIRDLTERREAEQALEESERRYRRIVETSSEGLWMIDADHRTTFVNPRMAEILGVRPQDMLGKHPFEFMDEEGRAITRAALDRRREGVSESYQSRLVHRDGRVVWTWMSSTALLENDGSYGGALAMVTDVSDVVEAEHKREELLAQLHQSQRLETVGKLAGGVAHDFNNLLAVILNFATFLQEELAEDELAAESLHEIRRAAERGATLTRRLLAFSRHDAGDPETLDLRRVVGDVRRMLERTLDKGVELEIDLPAELPPVSADVNQLEQVLLNLAVNARDAMPAGGRLRITLRDVEVDEQEAGRRPDAHPGRHACLEVADTGAGMSAEVAAQAFDPFFTTKPPGEGTGLGLAMVYGIVTQAGGHVTLDSSPGQGTTVAVYLPASPDLPGPTSSPGSPEPRAASGQAILVVDDEDAVRAGVARILSRHGYEVVEAAGGEEALALLGTLERPPDLLLTDVAMPRVSGPELAELIAGEHTPALPVVFMSGYSDAPEAVERAAGFIQKPFTAEKLLHAIGEALAGGVRASV